MFGNRKVMVEMPAESAGASGGGVVYAGFWARFAAVMVDSAIVTVVGVALMVVLFMAMGAAGVLIGNIAFFILQLLYWPVMESSTRQATFGKSLMGLEVTDLQGNRTSFVKSLVRNLAKILSSLIMMIGFLLAAFTARKQGLHDMLAGCLVVRTGPSSLLKAVVATVVALAIAGYGAYYYVTQIYMPQAMSEMQGGGQDMQREMDKAMKGAGQDMARDMDKAMKQAEAERKRKMQEEEAKRKMEQEAQRAAAAPPASAPASPVPDKRAAAATRSASKPAPAATAPVERKRAPAALPVDQSKTAANTVSTAPGQPSAPAVEAPAPRMASGPAPKYNDVMSAVLNRDHAGAAEALAAGIWVDRVDSTGTTPLMIAAENGDVAMVQLLLDNGADLNRIGRDGSVLRYAERSRDSKTIDLLRKAGAR